MTLRSQCMFASVLITTLAAAPLSAQQATEVDNVAAFARLYGVTRWFYPSDAAAAMDWNRFAIHGIDRVRAARTSAEVETTLQAAWFSESTRRSSERLVRSGRTRA
ncbi:MAG: hypothetical protein ABMA00_13125 [Gemmatimonas sp.]